MITWLDKIDGLDLGNPQKNVNAADMNQIKNTVNANETTLSGKVSSSTFKENEIPTGAINGSNVTYNLAFAPISGSLKLHLNGNRLNPSSFSLNISTITMVTAPETGDSLLADYRV